MYILRRRIRRNVRCSCVREGEGEALASTSERKSLDLPSVASAACGDGRQRKRAFLFQKSSLLAGAEGLESSTKVLETHVWRACRPPGTEFHITPLNWPFKSDFQSRMNIITEFLYLTRGHNKGPKNPRVISWLFACRYKLQKRKTSSIHDTRRHLIDNNKGMASIHSQKRRKPSKEIEGFLR